MSSEIKLRNLLSDPVKQDVCLDDLIFKLTNCSKAIAVLEHKNTKTALDSAKKQMNEFKRLYIEFENRIRGRVTVEVLDAVSKDTKTYGNPSYVHEKNLRARNNSIKSSEEM